MNASELTAADLERLPDDTRVWMDAMLECGARVRAIAPRTSRARIAEQRKMVRVYRLEWTGRHRILNAIRTQTQARVLRARDAWRDLESWDPHQACVPAAAPQSRYPDFGAGRSHRSFDHT